MKVYKAFLDYLKKENKNQTLTNLGNNFPDMKF